MKTYNANKKKYGEVTVGRKTVALTQFAYCDNYGTEGEVRYYAHAIDRNNNDYRVMWETVEGWDDHYCGEDGCCVMEDCGGWCEDESNACDWDSPVAINAV